VLPTLIVKLEHATSRVHDLNFTTSGTSTIKGRILVCYRVWPIYDTNGVIKELSRYQALMTRHNLDSHISWLLSHQVAPLAGVPITTATHSTAANLTSYADVETEIEEEEYTTVPSPAPNRRLAQAASVDQSFIRPAIPSNNTSRLAQGDKPATIPHESMGRLSSASRSTRPALISQQHQLATPASTTGSLTQGYASFLLTNNGQFNLGCHSNSRN
jgi:hypothetical protein